MKKLLYVLLPFLLITFGSEAQTCTAQLISALNTASQTVCVGSAITTINYVITDTSFAVNGLPPGINYTHSNDTVTISGIPTVSGSYTYSVSSTGSCAPVVMKSGTVNVSNTTSLSAVSDSTCINTAITPIVYNFNEISTIFSPNMPTGIDTAAGINSFSISGTPTQAGIFTYTVTLATNCGITNALGTIKVNAIPTVTVNSVTICSGTTTNLTASGANSYTWNTGQSTNSISVSPTTTTTYSVVGNANGCTNSTFATITVTPKAFIGLSSATPTQNQTLCVNTPLTSTTYTINGGGTGATFSGLPAGISGAYAGGVATISGTPTAISSTTVTSTYTVTTTGACAPASITGTVTVINTTSLSAVSDSTCINTAITPIVYNFNEISAVFSPNLPAGINTVSGTNSFSISGTPTQAGIFTYTITLAANCGNTNALGTIKVNAIPTLTVNSVTICSGTTTNLTASGANSYTWNTGQSTNSISVSPTTATTYTVTGNSNGCINSAIAFVHVNSDSATGSISGNILNYTSGSLPIATFTGNSGNPPYTFGYTVNNGSIQTISTTAYIDSVSIPVPAKTAATYTYTLVQIADSSGCGQVTNSLMVFTINPSTTGISTITDNDATIHVFPNPFDNNLNIAVKEKTTVKIIDITGKGIYSSVIEAGTTSIETLNVMPGIYFISFENSNGIINKKLIKN